MPSKWCSASQITSMPSSSDEPRLAERLVDDVAVPGRIAAVGKQKIAEFHVQPNLFDEQRRITGAPGRMDRSDAYPRTNPPSTGITAPVT